MYAVKPQMAEEWQAHTPPGTKLPKKKKIMKKSAMRTIDLKTVSVETAIERLAMRKVAVDNGIEQPLAAEILDNSDFLSSIATQVKQAESAMDPLARNALIGAGVGTVAGLGASAMSRRKNKNWFNNALLGGLAGGAVGGGYHMMTRPDALSSAMTDKLSPPPVNPKPEIRMPEEDFMALNEKATSKAPEIIAGTALTGGAAAGARYGLKKHLDIDKATGQLQGVLTDPKKREMAEEFLQRTHGSPLPRTRDTKGLVDDLVSKYDPSKADDPVNSLISKRQFNKINPAGQGLLENKLRYRAEKLISDPATSGRFSGSNYAKYDKLDDSFDVGQTLSKAHATDPAKLRASLAPVLGAAEKDLPQISRLGKAVRGLAKVNPKRLAMMAASLGLGTLGAYGVTSNARSNAKQQQAKVLELQKQRTDN